MKLRSIKMLSIKYVIPTFLIYFITSIFLFTIPSFLTWLSFFVATALTIYFMIYAIMIKKKKGNIEWRGRHIPSFFSLSITILPLLFGLAIAYEGSISWGSMTLAITASGLTTIFWYNFTAIPLAVIHKLIEIQESETPPRNYPKVNIIVPAYNEEKCIADTIEALLEVDYPDKEIMVVNDGSTDRTLEIAMQYASKGVKVLTKENGGKSSALNYAAAFSSGEIIVVIDADSIIERKSLKELVKRFEDPEVVAVCGNVKVLNRNNFLTKCQALEYILSINIIRRALDSFGSVTMVPGALGAFRRKALTEGGLYDKDTLTEDFDTTVKVLKSGRTIQASSFGSAYTQAPETLKDLYKQRMRWYRGNFQTVFKHRDALSNPRFGSLHRLGFPFVILHLFMLPFMSIFTWGSAILAIIEGSWLQVAYMFLMFLCLQVLVATLAIQIDDEDASLILYSPFFVVGFKHLIDFWVIKALFDVLFRKNLGWTRARRVTYQPDRKPLPVAPSAVVENLEKLASKRKQMVKFLLELRRSYRMGLISDESYDSLRAQFSEKLEEMEREMKKMRFDREAQLKEIEVIREEFPELHKVKVAKRGVFKRLLAGLNETILLVFAGIAFLVTGILFIAKIYDLISLLLFGVDMWILTLAFGVVLFLIAGVYASLRSSRDEDRLTDPSIRVQELEAIGVRLKDWGISTPTTKASGLPADLVKKKNRY